MTILKLVRRALAACAVSLLSIAAMAQPSYPSRTVTLVVPHPPGGYTDTVARLIAAGLGEKWKSTVIVDNRAGAGGSIGTAYAARREPDGYTLFLSSTGTDVINAFIYKKLEVDPASALEPVILVVKQPNVIVVNKDLPARTLAEFVALAKASPGRLNLGNPGMGTNSQFAGVMFASRAGIKLTEVPYKGSAAALTDVVNGVLQAGVDNVTFWAPNVKAGNARALAVTGLKRSPLLPEVPTLAESGMPGFEATTFTGISVPRGTPPEIVRKLNEDIQSLMATPEFRSRLNGGEIVGGSPESFRQYLAAQRQQLAPVAAALNLSLE